MNLADIILEFYLIYLPDGQNMKALHFCFICDFKT